MRLLGSRSSRFSICSSASCKRSESFLIRRTAISTLPRIIASNVFGSITRSLASSATTAPAERGLLFRMLISPKNSPAPKVARIFSVSRTVLVMFTLPAWTTYISLPGSPSRNRTCPRLNSFPNLWNSASSPAIQKSYQRIRVPVNFATRDANHAISLLSLLVIHSVDPVPALLVGGRHQPLAPGQHEGARPVFGVPRQERFEPQPRLGKPPPAVQGEPLGIACQQGNLLRSRQPAPAQLVHPHRLELSLHPHRIQLAHRVRRLVLQRLARRDQRLLGDQDPRAVLPVEPLQPAGEVHVVAHHRVVEALLRAHVAAHHRTRIDADADVDVGDRRILDAPLLAQARQRLAHLHRGLAAVRGVQR